MGIRRAVAAVMMVMAVVLPTLRAACDTSCVLPHEVERTAEAPEHCLSHETAPASNPGQPVESCTHDHDRPSVISARPSGTDRAILAARLPPVAEFVFDAIGVHVVTRRPAPPRTATAPLFLPLRI